MRLFNDICVCVLFTLLSCSQDDVVEHVKDPEVLYETTLFRAVAEGGFADIYEEETFTKQPVLPSELLSQARYIIYNSAGDIVDEKRLTLSELENGFKVLLPTGRYRICLLGEGRIENYIPMGTLTDAIYDGVNYASVWVAANQSSRKPVYRDYYFGEMEFASGLPGQFSVALKRVTGLLQIEIKDKPAGMIVREITVGMAKNDMFNNLHTDGNFSCTAQQEVTPSEPYAVMHSLDYIAADDYFEGVYLPTSGGSKTFDLLISYEKGGKVYSETTKVSGFVIERNKRTRVPLVIH